MDELEFKQKLAVDPGNPIFAQYAELLSSQGKWHEAIETCLKGLSRNPGAHQGRLTLAKLYYERGYIPFALKEVGELSHAFPQSQTLEKLRIKLGGSPDSVKAGLNSDSSLSLKGGERSDKLDQLQRNNDASSTGSEDNTVAEVELDFDVLEMIEKEEGKK